MEPLQKDPELAVLEILFLRFFRQMKKGPNFNSNRKSKPSKQPPFFHSIGLRVVGKEDLIDIGQPN
jgi:hypothetical protein